ncbi:Uncharacterised protein [uncultured archaeon]|nr:Uncharacterised protein [uncultured archaeon]
MQTFDLVRFSPDASWEDAAARLTDVRTLPPSVFSSVPDVERARVMMKRAKFIHMPIWQPDVGLARLFKEHGAVMVIGLADLLLLPPLEMGKRLSRTAHMAQMVRHFGGSVRLASMARNENELRNPLELACVGERLGLPPGVVMKALSESPLAGDKA